MKITGAGWVSAVAYGAVRKQLRHEYENELLPALKTDGVLCERVKNFGKFSLSTRRSFCAAALALHDAGFTAEPASVAVIGMGSEESASANHACFSDYVAYGRKLARANLFIYTLPTSPLAEIAIHFKLGGPLFYTSDHFLRAANGLLAGGEASHVLALWAEKDCTAALLLNSEESNGSEMFQRLKTPEQLIHFLQDYFSSQNCKESSRCSLSAALRG